MAGISRAQNRQVLLPAALLGVAAFLAVLAYRIHAGAGYPLDDSWIHLAYAKNFITGNGFAATAGEPTPGATSPLWVVLLSPGFLFGEVHGVWPWLLGALTLGAASFLAYLTARHLIGDGSELLPLSAGLLVAANGPLVWSAAGAMEVPLFVAMLLLTLFVFGRGGSGWKHGLIWGALTGLTALSRPEGLILLGLLPAITLLGRSRASLLESAAGIGAALITYSPSVIFSLSTAGRIFPNTFYAKTTQLVAGAPDVSFLAGVTKFWFTESPVSAIGAVAGIAVTILALRKDEPRRLPLALLGFTLGLPVAYAMMGRTYLFTELAGNFGRYLYPIFPPALVLGAWALSKVRAKAAPVVILLAIALTLFGTVRRADLYRHNVADINALQVAMAQKLDGRLPAGSQIAANDVGALAFFTDYRVLDLIGIISTQTLDRLEYVGEDPRARMQALYDLMLQERPEVLVVFPQWYTPILNALGDGAAVIATADKRDNITAGGARLVAFQVNWPPR